MRGLADHAWPGEAYHGLRFRQGNITESGKAGHDTGRCRISQNGDIGESCLAMTGQGAAGLGHLHEGEHPLVHAGTSRGTDDDDGLLGLGGGLNDAGNLLTDYGAHGGRQKGEIHHGQPHRMTPHSPQSGDHGIDESGLLPVGLETIFIGGDSPETQRIHRRHRGIHLHEGPFVHQ